MAENVKQIPFLKNKYGNELLFDIGKIKSHKNFILTAELHALEFYEIIFLTEGAGSVWLDEEKIKIKPGIVIFTSPNQVRKWEITVRPEGYVLLFDGNFIHAFFNDALFLYRFHFFHNYSSLHSIKTEHSNFQQLEEILIHIQNEIGNLKEDSDHFLRAYLYLCLILLNRSFARQHSLSSASSSSINFFRFRELLEKNIYAYNTVKEFAEDLTISTTYLNRVCKVSTGKSAGEIIRQRKLLEAKRLLRYSSLTAAEVAYKLNFSGPANFSRFFQHHTNQSPSVYKLGY
jgi:AraC family transcriptional regulator, transcriptional activator of pobA